MTKVRLFLIFALLTCSAYILAAQDSALRLRLKAGDKAVSTIEVDEEYTFYVCTAPHINETSVNLNFDETLELMDFLSENKVDLVLQGHDHYREDLRFNGVRYTVVGTIRDEIEAPEYLRVIVTDKGLQLVWELL